MIIVFRPHATEAQIQSVSQRVTDSGYEPRLIRGTEQSVIAAVGDETSHKSLDDLIGLAFIEKVMPVQKRYKLVSREFHPEDTVIDLGVGKIGGGNKLLMAGPCSVESRAQLRATAAMLASVGVKVFRGGAYKPRTSPYDFQGMREEGLELLHEIKEEFGMAIVSEVTGTSQVPRIAEVCDLIQIGARNCQNYDLLERVAGAGRPVLLKRGMATKIDEWLLAAEYLIVHGCNDVILCERGIRTFETATRFTLDLAAVAVAKRETHLPVIVDPSHAAGVLNLVLPLARAGLAVGADGLIVETHPNPASALSDAAQQIPCEQFPDFVKALCNSASWGLW